MSPISNIIALNPSVDFYMVDFAVQTIKIKLQVAVHLFFLSVPVSVHIFLSCCGLFSPLTALFVLWWGTGGRGDQLG